MTQTPTNTAIMPYGDLDRAPGSGSSIPRWPLRKSILFGLVCSSGAWLAILVAIQSVA